MRVITSGGTATALYDYDLKNKLSAVTTGGSTTKYEYNHQGIRVRTVTASSTKYYLVDGNNHTGYAQVLEEMNTLGTPTMSYVLGDDVLAQCGTTTSDPAYLLYDGHGSTRQLVHSTVNVTEQYNYDAYGVSLTTLSTPETTMLYSGEQYDSTLGSTIQPMGGSMRGIRSWGTAKTRRACTSMPIPIVIQSMGLIPLVSLWLVGSSQS